MKMIINSQYGWNQVCIDGETTRLRSGQSRVRVPTGKWIYLITEMSRLILAPTHSRNHTSPASSPSSSEVKNLWTYASQLYARMLWIGTDLRR